MRLTENDCPELLVYQIESECGALIKTRASTHERQSTACVCFMYSLVTTGLKSKNEERQPSSIQIIMACLEQREKESRKEKVCVLERKQVYGGKRDDGRMG